MRIAMLASLLLAALPLHASDCRLDGERINTDNGSTYAGKSGRILCYDEEGELKSEQEVRNGELFGYERQRDFFDGGWIERTTNANHNTHGEEKKFWPDGTLKSEGRYDDGNLVGEYRSFHKNGKPARISHADGAVLEYDDRGRLKNLVCGKRSQLEEDRVPCGFAGETTTVLHFNAGRQLRVTYRDGNLLAQEEVAEDGNTTASAALENGVEVRRSFHPDGKPATELRVADGFHVEEREWYMNGQLKSHTVREPKERDARAETAIWRDDGTKQSVEVSVGNRRVSYTQFDKAGALAQIDDFAAAGHLERRRKYAPDGKLIAEEAFYPDGSRK